ncbi:SIR2 family protein [Vibrio splendidus]|uniref:SIR2 family protein n=1 Tax=Vibrio splendidus TaxID=29497 RepID=UPI000C834370|nr:SIR2 family protein [Vibrio splendidus]PMI49221.1 hypothetical protein BCU42_15575 [Vibrio splendidus]
MTFHSQLDQPYVPAADSTVISIESLKSKLKEKDQDIVFFTGAGFSKAWNDCYPLGFALFSIDFDSNGDSYNFLTLADKLHIPRPLKHIEVDIKEKIHATTDDLKKYKLEEELKAKNYDRQCYNFLSEIKYHLDLYKKYPSIMPNFLDATLISGIECEIKQFVRSRFLELTKKDTPLDAAHSKSGNQHIVRFFKEINNAENCISFISTNYDFVIEKIFSGFGVNFFERGFIQREALSKNIWGKDETKIYKLNGGFEIYSSNHNYCIDYAKARKKKPNPVEFETPSIIIPSQEQDYSDRYFENCFSKASNKLRAANKLVFIGYSLPKEDNAIRFLLKNFLDCPEHKLGEKEIYVISYSKSDALSIRERVMEVYPRLAKKEFAITALEDGFTQLVTNN